MAKRITEHRVRNWAIGGGASGGVVILLLFAFLSSLGSIEVTGYSGDMICAGTLEDPCIATIDFTAKEDIFIYPSENWSNAILETDKSVNSVKMFRSWGTGWREIKLNEVCTGTWCGAPNNNMPTECGYLPTPPGCVKYAYAFREGRNYTIKYEVLKNSPYDKIKWSFGPVDPLFDSVADIELVSESNSLTYGDAVVKITPKISFAFEGTKVDTWVNKITPAMDLIKYEMKIGQNISYQEEVWVKDITCNPWNETTANGTIEHPGCVDNGYTDYITKYKITYVPFENQNFQLTAGEPIYLKVYGEWPAQTGQVIYDWKINLDGYITPFQWWVSLYNSTRLLSNFTGDIIYINLSYSNFTDAQVDWDDLRFLDITNTTEYGYLLQDKVNSAWATFRIKTLGASSLYIYYGNATVSSTSNINDVYGSNLNASWFMDKNSGTNVEDFAGDGNDGTMVAMEVGDWVGGKIGNALNFGGTNEYVNFGTMGSLGSGLGNGISASFWIKTTTSTANAATLGTSDGGDTAFYSYINYPATGKVYFTLRDEDNTGIKPKTDDVQNIRDGAWHHIVLTGDGPGNVGKIYVDGDSKAVTDDTATAPNNFVNFVYPMLLGAYNLDGNPTAFIVATLDEFAIYNKVINSTEVGWLYNITEPVYVLGAKEQEILDKSPTVTLNTPTDAATLTSLSVIFNCTAYDDINLINVSLYIDGSLNETNTSGVNNSDYIFSKNLTAPGDHNWTCQGCDNASQCTTATTRTFSIILNLTGWVTDNVGNFLAGASVIINNQSDNSFVANVTTNGTGFWTYGPVLSGTYVIEGYEPLNATRHGDSKPHVIVP